jgi:hypothetical protein
VSLYNFTYCVELYFIILCVNILTKLKIKIMTASLATPEGRAARRQQMQARAAASPSSTHRSSQGGGRSQSGHAAAPHAIPLDNPHPVVRTPPAYNEVPKMRPPPPESVSTQGNRLPEAPRLSNAPPPSHPSQMQAGAESGMMAPSTGAAASASRPPPKPKPKPKKTKFIRKETIRIANVPVRTKVTECESNGAHKHTPKPESASSSFFGGLGKKTVTHEANGKASSSSGLPRRSFSNPGGNGESHKATK